MANWMNGCVPTRYSGIWKTNEGYRVRARAVDPRTGKMKEVNRHLKDISLREAVVEQAKLKEGILDGRGEEPKRERYADFAERYFERKLAKGKLTTPKSQRTWADTQDLHLIPAFGDWHVDAIRHRDIDEWLTRLGQKVQRRELSPNTVNGWLRVLCTTLRAAVVELRLDVDPTMGIEPLDTSTWHTFTEEEPNALLVQELRVFMEKAWEMYPQHYAMLALGFSTGRRPSELRPLRHRGESADIRWEDGVLLIRRTQYEGEAVERTKTGRSLRIPLPEEMLSILRWHVRNLQSGPMRESELLFPSTQGGFRSPNVLAKPIRRIAAAAGIRKHLSAKCMRRTFQDLGRAAKVHDFVVEAISGHATVDMHRRYSTVAADEVREGLAKVISLAGFAEARKGTGEHVADPESGDAGGYAAAPGRQEAAAGA